MTSAVPLKILTICSHNRTRSVMTMPEAGNQLHRADRRTSEDGQPLLSRLKPSEELADGVQHEAGQTADNGAVDADELEVATDLQFHLVGG
jgi:hypothetical protein